MHAMLSPAAVSIFTLPECVLAVNPGQRDSTNSSIRRGGVLPHTHMQSVMQIYMQAEWDTHL